MSIKAKIAAALTLDPLFKTYKLTWKSEEVVEYMKQVPSLGKADNRALVRLVQEINGTVPVVKGRARHIFLIGRRNGLRLIEVDIFDSRWTLEENSAMREQIYAIAKRAGSKPPDVLGEESLTTLRMVWK